MVNPEQIAAARALKPIHERLVFGRSILLFDRVERQQLAALGDVRTPSIADLFVAVLSNQSGAAQGGLDEYSIKPVPGSPLESQVTAPAVITASRRMYWSVRRELWENRSIYIAPLAAAAFSARLLDWVDAQPAHRHEPLDIPYDSRLL